MKRRLSGLLVVWLILLAASHLVRALRDDPFRLVVAPDQAIELPSVASDGSRGAPIRLVYRDSGPRDAPVVLLLHGSPGSRTDFRNVRPELESRYRLIAPDLPGFGLSASRVPDYSIRAHAAYCVDLLDRLGIERAHVVGFSMGGGVGLELYAAAPQRVASLTLLSAIGVQELELFGNYRLNHVVHGAQLAAIGLLQEALPHFGLLDDMFLGQPYARNFYDTDQRPLRGILQRFEPPLLILHGVDDPLVPEAAAREHARIVPHSDLQMRSASHFMVFAEGPEVAHRMSEFFVAVERGVAPRRAQSTAARRALANVPFDPASVPAPKGIALVLILFAISVATLVSEDLACIVAGLLAGQGRLPFVPAVIACAFGIFVGDMLLFAAGRWLGRPALARAPLKWLISADQVDRSSHWFNRRGPIVIAISRFIPGMRLPTYFAAGLLRTRTRSFAFYFALAVAVWTPILVGVSALVGERTFGYFEALQRHLPAALLILGLWILIVVKLLVPAFTWRGRRQLVGAWLRWTRWEFWPPWLFYTPVAVYLLGLALRYRHPLLFTAANPAIEAGGVISESKRSILAGLASTPEAVAQHAFLPQNESVVARLQTIDAFQAQHDLGYPLVLKPDAGQRGSGVRIVHDLAQVCAYLETARFDAVVQEYVPGHEFGVFYIRRPGEDQGSIFSITEKQLPTVTGDGHSTLERLILFDPRAVAMARHYLAELGGRVHEIPAAGEQVRLVELGTHCRGAIFLDGARFKTAELERSIDRISRGFEGFYFGRYDLRVEDLERFAAGEGFKVLELNGVTSEATHIYDPEHGLFAAWTTLFEQWKIAFEIGAANRSRGHDAVGFRQLLRLLAEYRGSSRTHP